MKSQRSDWGGQDRDGTNASSSYEVTSHAATAGRYQVGRHLGAMARGQSLTGSIPSGSHDILTIFNVIHDDS
jgi:hypothetical protein